MRLEANSEVKKYLREPGCPAFLQSLDMRADVPVSTELTRWRSWDRRTRLRQFVVFVKNL
jgi:hypothetical protein